MYSKNVHVLKLLMVYWNVHRVFKKVLIMYEEMLFSMYLKMFIVYEKNVCIKNVSMMY